MHAIPETESPESCFEKAPLQLCKFIENLQYYEDIAGIMLKWRHARSPIIMDQLSFIYDCFIKEYNVSLQVKGIKREALH